MSSFLRFLTKNADYLPKAYELAWFLCPDHELIVKEIIPHAVRIEELMMRTMWLEEKEKWLKGEARFHIAVDGRVIDYIHEREKKSATLSLPLSAWYLEIKSPEGVDIANCSLLDPYDGLDHTFGHVPFS